MTGFDRRTMLLLMGAALPALASRPVRAQVGTPLAGQLAERQDAGAAARILPPPSPMVYTRRLIRRLSGDAQIMVERRFAVLFVPDPEGFLVEGEQTGVEVETPAKLAALAALERARMESGIFPLQLDPVGQIRSGEAANDVPEIEEAMRLVTERIAASPSTDVAQVMRTFIAAVHEAGTNIVSSLPHDLFAPLDTDRTATRSIDLPPGGQGLVTTQFSARRDPLTGLMTRAQRDVTTRIGNDKRLTREVFTLTRQSPALL